MTYYRNRAAVGNDDHRTLVPHQLADRDGDEQPDQREVEHQIPGLTQIPLFRGNRYLGILFGPDGYPPALERLPHSGEGLVMRDVNYAVEMVRQPGQIPRCSYRLAPKRAEMRLQAWNKTADEREKQQDVDRSEPEAGKDVEQLQLVE